jgi:DNA-binding response OmpR family regulator
LHRSGHRTVSAESASAALHLLDGCRPDLVVAELSCSGRDARALERLRRPAPGGLVPIVYFTGEYVGDATRPRPGPGRGLTDLVEAVQDALTT